MQGAMRLKRICHRCEGATRESDERRKADEMLSEKLKQLAVGGLNLEVIGLVWLLLGTVGTSIPEEVAWVIRRLFWWRWSRAGAKRYDARVAWLPMNHRVEAEGGSPLGAAGRAFTVAAAFASVALTLWVGRGGPSLVLMVLFVGWVLLPFAGLLFADRMAVRWSPVTRTTLYIVMLIVAVASVVAYGAVALRPRAQPAFMFLAVPFCSWALVVGALGIAAFVSRSWSGKE
jgi:hypothetical protein